jgi:hypothetical protein
VAYGSLSSITAIVSEMKCPVHTELTDPPAEMTGVSCGVDYCSLRTGMLLCWVMWSLWTTT